MSFPKEGKVLPRAIEEAAYALAIAGALRAGVGETHQAVKTVARWTGANERTVKNWFSGACGPSGAHLLCLMQRSDQVLETVLRLSGRQQVIAISKLAVARDKLAEIVTLLDTVPSATP
ncbi:MAG TPA: hypothetical protein VN668_09715 [Stellaceae bacterium]|nr:hypothetical protein [Stellaceae bacterium]